MKREFIKITFGLIILLSSCSIDKTKIVSDSIDNLNSLNLKKFEVNLTDDFIYQMQYEKKNKNEYIKSLDSLDFKKNITQIVDLSESDTTVVALINFYSIYDSLLNIKPYRQFKRIYFFKNNKINKIQVDTIIGNKKYCDEYNEKFFAYIQWVADIYPALYSNYYDYKKKNQALLNEFSKLSDSVKVKFKIEAILHGTFKCPNCLYTKLEFKEFSTVIIYDSLNTLPLKTNYSVDGNSIKIKTNKSDLLLEVISPKILKGEGFTKVIYNKQKDMFDLCKNISQEKD